MSIHPGKLIPGKIAESTAARVEMLAPVARFSLRAHGAERQDVAAALGLDLPVGVGDVTRTDSIAALNLGPDEWLIHLPEAGADAITGRKIDAAHSLVDVSDRELTLSVTGPRATDLLTLGCPRDPDSIEVGQGRRTLFDGATVILWRDGTAEWRMDVWRSFAPHVVSLLATGCAELAAE